MITPLAPTPSAWRASATASFVAFVPTPITSVTRPWTIFATSSAKDLRSSPVRCENSPLLPRATMPSTPASIRRSITTSVVRRSTSPCSSKGVTIAGINPENIEPCTSCVVEPGFWSSFAQTLSILYPYQEAIEQPDQAWCRLLLLVSMNKLSVPISPTVRGPALPAPEEEAHDKAEGTLRDAGVLTVQEAG